MDQHPQKRGPSGPTTSKKAHSSAAKNPPTCSRTVCSERRTNVQITRAGSSDKPKFANTSFRSSVGNDVTRKPLKSSPITKTSANKPCLDSKRVLSSQAKFELSESSASSSVRPRIISHRNKSQLNNQNSPPARSVPLASRTSASGSSNPMVRRRSFERESGSSSRERKVTHTPSMSRPIIKSQSMAKSVPEFQNRRNDSSVRERAVVTSELPNSELQPSVGSRSTSLSFSTSGSRSSDSVDFTSEEHGFTQLMDDDMLRGYNMVGVAEMLFALERIEQDQEMTHEELLALETSLFLGSLSLYDRHRDMRLDIDSMSYEEEYVDGDEMGSLVECQHGFHMMCINQWLKLKNWCPVCKTSAGPSQTSSS
ncbi:RING/U-box superfamily protein [Striga hermonthica]|uniref:RING-type E3 ubiquitin transferase n=1 Tax=Striga hermonthica TaxID=68872 RepID=A0A9N7NJY9_STRHE|nr:RING/U-box superfamily protein [Striga hermonthica]